MQVRLKLQMLYVALRLAANSKFTRNDFYKAARERWLWYMRYNNERNQNGKWRKRRTRQMEQHAAAFHCEFVLSEISRQLELSTFLCPSIFHFRRDRAHTLARKQLSIFWVQHFECISSVKKRVNSERIEEKTTSTLIFKIVQINIYIWCLLVCGVAYFGFSLTVCIIIAWSFLVWNPCECAQREHILPTFLSILLLFYLAVGCAFFYWWSRLQQLSLICHTFTILPLPLPYFKIKSIGNRCKKLIRMKCIDTPIWHLLTFKFGCFFLLRLVVLLSMLVNTNTHSFTPILISRHWCDLYTT